MYQRQSLTHYLLVDSLPEISQQLPHTFIIWEPFYRIFLPVLVLLEVEQFIEGQFEHVVQHSWNQHLQNWTVLLYGWVGVDLDQPGPVCVIDHEVKTKKLETVFAAVYVDSSPGRAHGEPRHFSYFSSYLDVYLLRWHKLSQIWYSQLISWLLIILVTKFLDRIVGQMDERVFVIVCWVFMRWKSEISFFE